jgi:hypothetical protein
MADNSAAVKSLVWARYATCNAQPDMRSISLLLAAALVGCGGTPNQPDPDPVPPHPPVEMPPPITQPAPLPAAETRLVDGVFHVVGITDDGQVIYEDTNEFSIAAVPLAGGAPVQIVANGQHPTIRGNRVTGYDGDSAWVWSAAGGLHRTAVYRMGDFSDDGSRIVYGAHPTASQPVTAEVWVANSDGSGSPRKLYDGVELGGTSGCMPMAAFSGDKLLLSRCAPSTRESTVALIDLGTGAQRDLAGDVSSGFLAAGDLAVYYDIHSFIPTAVRLSTGVTTALPERTDGLASIITSDGAIVYVPAGGDRLRRATIGATVDVIDLTTTTASSPQLMLASPDGRRVAWRDPYVWTLADAVMPRSGTLATGGQDSSFAVGYGKWAGYSGSGAVGFSDDSRFAFYIDHYGSEHTGSLTAVDADGGGGRVVADRCAQVRTAGAGRIVFTANSGAPSPVVKAELFRADLASSDAPVQLASDVSFDAFYVNHEGSHAAYLKYGAAPGIYRIGLN